MCVFVCVHLRPPPALTPIFQLLDYTSYNQPWWVVYDPKQPGANTSVIMPMQEWACNYLLGIAQA